MPNFSVQVEVRSLATYIVEAETADEANEIVLRGTPGSPEDVVDGDPVVTSTVLMDDDFAPDPDTTVTATFTGQAWINDYATNVDGGVYTYLITVGDLNESRRLLSQSLDLDFLKNSRNAPPEVMNWSGPFEITIDDDLTGNGYTVTKDEFIDGATHPFTVYHYDNTVAYCTTEEEAWDAAAEHYSGLADA